MHNTPRDRPALAQVLAKNARNGATRPLCQDVKIKKGENMANLDWSKCPAVESVADRRSGAWVFKDTRMPVATVFENLEAGSSI